MSDWPISESRSRPAQFRIARNSGWRRANIAWERWQAAARVLQLGCLSGAADRFVTAEWARSSLFHLRLAAKHRAAFRENRIARLRAMVGECLECLLAERPFPHRLFDRWLGEKPPIYDDARKLLSACLLIASR